MVALHRRGRGDRDPPEPRHANIPAHCGDGTTITRERSEPCAVGCRSDAPRMWPGARSTPREHPVSPHLRGDGATIAPRAPGAGGVSVNHPRSSPWTRCAMHSPVAPVSLTLRGECPGDAGDLPTSAGRIVPSTATMTAPHLRPVRRSDHRGTIPSCPVGGSPSAGNGGSVFSAVCGKGEPVKLSTEVLHHVVALGLVMDQRLPVGCVAHHAVGETSLRMSVDRGSQRLPVGCVVHHAVTVKVPPMSRAMSDRRRACVRDGQRVICAVCRVRASHGARCGCIGKPDSLRRILACDVLFAPGGCPRSRVGGTPSIRR